MSDSNDVQGRSHRAHKLNTTLSAAYEAVDLSLRQSLYLPLDDLLYIIRQYIMQKFSVLALLDYSNVKAFPAWNILS